MTDTDKGLLERAARAAGLIYRDDLWNSGHIQTEFGTWKEWSPLTDNCDAFRLESGLRLDVKWGNGSVTVGGATERYSHGDDPSAIKRRAIVRAAAALGDAK